MLAERGKPGVSSRRRDEPFAAGLGAGLEEWQHAVGPGGAGAFHAIAMVWVVQVGRKWQALGQRERQLCKWSGPLCVKRGACGMCREVSLGGSGSHVGGWCLDFRMEMLTAVGV